MAGKILIAEDDGDIRRLYGYLLRSSGYDVIEAVDGQDALEKFTETPCDMAIVDMNMPRMSGMDLIKALRRLSSDVHIILITAYGTSETARRAFSLGSNEYIPKPFEVDHLQERVRAYFEKKKRTV